MDGSAAPVELPERCHATLQIALSHPLRIESRWDESDTLEETAAKSKPDSLELTKLLIFSFYKPIVDKVLDILLLSA